LLIAAGGAPRQSISARALSFGGREGGQQKKHDKHDREERTFPFHWHHLWF